jgi:hypothetical protein
MLALAHGAGRAAEPALAAGGGTAPVFAEAPTGDCAVPRCGRAGRCPVMADLHVLDRHLRRVRQQVESELREPSRTGRHLRLTAGRLAYADLLLQACRTLQIPTELPRCTGLARDVEILRVEAALARYGLASW